MVVLYDLSLSLYYLLIRLVAPWNPKARLWIKGRKEAKWMIGKYQQGLWIWFHCASLEEFEQGRPLIESIRPKYPKHKILLTFYSPSGYTVRKGYPGADLVMYLPFDTRSNAKKMVEAFRPEAVFFVKYEY